MLCLGDSYTIGEAVEEGDRFPNQAALLLHSKGIYFEKPKIIAQTGWTADELTSAIEKENITHTFDFVTLLIGVNDQYRARSTAEYRIRFSELLKMSVVFAGGKPKHVIVLSIPDWGATLFAEGRDRKKIAEEIDQFNTINEDESLKNDVHYIQITQLTREHADWLVEDGLHYSGKMYAMWSEQVATIIEKELK